MRLALRLTATMLGILFLAAPKHASAISLSTARFQLSAMRESSPSDAKPAAVAPANPAIATVTVDSIVERIEDDIITDSQVRELQDFQKLLGGTPKNRDEVIGELTDQWIIRNDAETSKFRQPSQEAADRAFAQVTSKFTSPQQLQAQLTQLGLTESDARRMVTEELYLTSFLDFKFRPTAQVSPDQMQAYYQDTLVPELKSRGEQPPPFPSVEEQIREVLTQKAIDQRTQEWLEETRARLQIERVLPGDQP